MKPLLLTASFLLATGTLAAQTATTIITANSLKMAGAKITTGTVTIIPVNLSGTAIVIADGSGSQNGPMGFTCAIANGAISGLIQPDRSVSGACAVPDSSLTVPSNILYTIQVNDTSVGRTTSGRSYVLPNITGITGATWALDHYAPPAQTSAAQVLQAAHGPTLPLRCIPPAIFTLDSTSAFYTCVGTSYVQVTPGPGVITFGTDAGTAAVGNDPRILGAEQSSNKGSAGGYAGLDSSGHIPTAYMPPMAAGDTTRGSGQLAETVVGIQGKLVSPVAPAAGQALIYNGSAYAPATPEQAANKGAPSGYAGLDGAGHLPAAYMPATPGGDTSRIGGQLIETVVAIQGRPVSTTAPANGQALVWNGTAYVPATPAGGLPLPNGFTGTTQLAPSAASPSADNAQTGSGNNGLANLRSGMCASTLISCVFEVSERYGNEFSRLFSVPIGGNAEAYYVTPMANGKGVPAFARDRRVFSLQQMSINPGVLTYDTSYPGRISFLNWCNSTNRLAQAEDLACMKVMQRIHGAGHNYILSFVGQKANHEALSDDTIVTSSMQGGSQHGSTLVQTAPGDDMLTTVQHETFGVTEGEDEATKFFRAQMGTSLVRWGGPLTAAPTDPLGIGRYVLRISQGAGYNIKRPGEDIPVINLARPYTAGNMTLFGQDPTYPALALVQFDATAAIVPHFGTSVMTKLTAPIDNLVDAGTCPRTGIGAVSSPDLSITTEDGAGGKLFCVTVASTDGLTAGPISIAGAHSNLEQPRIVQIVDATHFTEWGQMYHEIGEVVSQGGVQGKAVCPLNETMAAGTMDGSILPTNSVDLHRCWPLIGNDASGNVHAYIDSARASVANMQGYASTTPQAQVVVGGTALTGTALTSITFSNPGRFDVNGLPLLNPTGNRSYQATLSAPTLTINSPNCSVQPTAHTILAAVNAYQQNAVPVIDTPGTCTAPPLASEVHVQTVWLNPYMIVNMTIARKVVDADPASPSYGSAAAGYLMTDALNPSDWHVNDLIEEPGVWHDSTSSYRYFGKYFTMQGNKQGADVRVFFGRWGVGDSLDQIVNTTPGTSYFANATHPVGPGVAFMQPPTARDDLGVFATYHHHDLPPTVAMDIIDCDSAETYHPCQDGVAADFDRLWLRSYNNALADLHLHIKQAATQALSAMSWTGKFLAMQLLQTQAEIAVPYSAAPALNPTFLLNKVALTGNISPTIGSGIPGQSRVCMVYLKPSTSSSFSITYPANMLGGQQPMPGTLRAKQCFDWVPSDNAFEADAMLNF